MPLYAWLATALLRATGDSVLALDALKYLFVGGMWLALASTAERLRPGTGVIAIAFAFLLPTVNDDLLGEVSHTAAQMCAGAVSAWLIVRALDGETSRLWLWLGLVWAGGLAAKHSMIPLVAAEFAAVALLAGPARARMLRHMVQAACIMVALCAPLYAILAMAPETVEAQLAEFFTDRGLPGALMDGLTSPLAEAGLLILGIAALAAWKRPALGRARWVLVAVCAGFVCAIIGGVLMSGATVLRDRWLAAGLVLLAPVAASMVPRPQRWRGLAGGLVLAAAAARAAETAGLL
ncbi:glycosyltransferase family 39 protein [Maricaulis maris]|uniref:Dolichyl-phosphate-mannose-protein mannosyltransferase n=1 Tax=Maricaulis maris TaxID=74318 RepID=A0A495DLU8_9PROT|nr:glycosyltransferase family 39 protein [Maricaulis maris]RKR02696.1 dolichyl-phosphate-mannose-protein mannosyltransferase [Maricaulis maris]